MEHEGHPYRGFLYVGLMLTADGPKVIEFNVRFGDPEAQVVLPMLDEDLSWLLGAAATGALPSRPARFRDEPHVGVVLAAGGYPDAPETGKAIDGLDAAQRVPGALVFHAGTAERDGQLVTAGGRVLTVVGRGATYRDAIDTAYAAASRIRFDGMQYPPRHRPEGAVSRRTVTEVRRRHVRLPRQPGRLAGDRRRSCGREAPSCAARGGRPGRRQHVLGHGDRRSGRAADDPAHRARQPRRAESS